MLSKWQPGSLFGRLLAANLIVIIITLLAIGFFLSYLVEKYFFSAREWELVTQAEKVAEMLAEEFQQGNFAGVERIAQTLAVSLDLKIRVIEPQYQEIVVTTSAPEEEDDTEGVGLERAEVEQVLQGNTLTKKVYGPEMQRLLIAMPVFEEQAWVDTGDPEVIGAITVSAPITGIRATIAQISRLTLYSGLFATILASILAFSLAKTISLPVRAMTQAARELVRGNFQSRMDVNATGELGELAATFNQAVDEIEKTVEEQKRLQALRQNLIANVSHEFRAPLTSIQGFVDAMLEGFVAEEEQEQYLRIILDNTLHLNRLVNDLLELSSLESGHVQLQWGEVHPGQVLERAYHSITPKAREKEIQLRYTCEENLPPVFGDQDRLYQVLVNLLENAIMYTATGGEITLEARYNSTSKEIVFSVQDTGSGIPAPDLPYIWDRFYKVDKARNRAQKGKGLGLAIVKELVDMHQGRVDVESTPGRGSTFYVILPATVKKKEYTRV